MADHIKQSLLKLEQSLDALDQALVKQHSGAQTHDNLNEEIDLLSKDRSELANQLDAAINKIDDLESQNEEIEQRIRLVMSEVEALLVSDEDQDHG